MSDTDQLATLLNQKHAVLVQLRALAQRQFDLAQDGEAGAMISLLAVKQGLLDGLLQIEDNLKPFRTQDPDQRVWRSPEDRAACAAVSEQCQSLLNEVMELDRGGMQLLQARQQHSKVQIDAAHQAASARNAYAGNVAPARSSIDLASK